MNWRRIFAILALATWACLIGVIIWIGPQPGARAHAPRPGFSRFALSEATVVLQFQNRNPVGCFIFVSDYATVPSSAMDLNTYTAMLRSLKLSRDALASLNPDELSHVLGPQFTTTGRSGLGGLSVEPMRQNGEARISIKVLHQNPVAARLFVGSICSEFAKHLRKHDFEANERALQYFRERRARMAEESKDADAQLEEARHSKDLRTTAEVENSARIRREDLRRIDDRIADTVNSHKTPSPLPFRVVEARILSGPFWNRSISDFTAEAQRLTER